MKNQPNESLDPQEELRASTEILRIKLQLEHDMVISDTAGLSPEVENKWLSNIYNFEKQFRDAGTEKVYDLLGRPAFQKWNTLTENQLYRELKRVLSLMEEKNIELDCCCQYSNEVMYRFITEELFEHETDSIFVEGMTRHFIYEEFHPNHDYDLRRQTTSFIESLLKRRWDEEFDIYKLGKTISTGGKELSASTFSEMVKIFQGAYSFFEIENIEFKTVDFNIDENQGKVEAKLSYTTHSPDGKKCLCIGPCILNFRYDSGDWDIVGLELPGLTS